MIFGEALTFEDIVVSLEQIERTPNEQVLVPIAD